MDFSADETPFAFPPFRGVGFDSAKDLLGFGDNAGPMEFSTRGVAAFVPEVTTYRWTMNSSNCQ